MDVQEARHLLAERMEHLSKLSYAELASRIGEPEIVEVTGASGAHYTIEVEVHWDARPQGDIRVLGAIDDGRWRAFAPLTADFIMAPDGRLAGE